MKRYKKLQRSSEPRDAAVSFVLGPVLGPDKPYSPPHPFHLSRCPATRGKPGADLVRNGQVRAGSESKQFSIDSLIQIEHFWFPASPEPIRAVFGVP